MTNFRAFAFGPFLLLPERQLLLRGDAPVRIGSRALDLLTALVERPGELVTKAELMQRAWPTTVVVEANLKVHIGALRRALDDVSETSLYIATVTGRGYRFVTPVQQGGQAGQLPQSPLPPPSKDNLPTATTRIFGRAAAIASLCNDVEEARLVSVVGAAGIGKTTVALAVAAQQVGRFRDGIWLVDLAPTRDPGLAVNAIATAVGLTNHASNVLESLCEFLRARQTLLVLDNCEHVIDAAAACASHILSAAGSVKILTTSREPLSVRGERVRRLQALGTPPPEPGITAQASLEFAAVALFVERATEKLESFRLTDANAYQVGEICRRLDGLALAITLAAARVDAFGVHELLARLDQRLGVLQGLRTEPERQRTLAAALDWSYGLLDSGEKALLRAVSVFAGTFDGDDATAVSGSGAVEVAERLAQLAAKSLLDIDADVETERITYRLLETTRVYCIDKLQADRVEEHAVRQRHAERVCTVLESARDDRPRVPAPQWAARYGRVLPDLRTALAWAKREAPGNALPVRLTVAGLLLWEHFSLTSESRLHAADAIAGLGPAGLLGTAQEMHLLLGLGASAMYIQGQKDEARAAMERALSVAYALGDTDAQLRCLMSISAYQMWAGEARAGKRSLDAFGAIAAERDPGALVACEIHHGVGDLMLGDLASARRRFESVQQRDVRSASASNLGYILDPYAQAGGILCQVQWVMGLPEASLRSAQACLDAGLASAHHLTVNNALSITCAAYYWSGRYAECDRCVTLLEEHFQRHRIITRRPIASFYRAALVLSQLGDAAAAVGGLQAAVADFQSTNHLVRQPYYLSVLADALTRCGRIGEAQATIDQALDIARAQEEGWCLAEVLRIRAGVLVARGEHTAADTVLVDAMAQARQVGALSWRLRAATDLARLRAEAGDAPGACAMLRAVVGEFSEGFETRDLQAAAQQIAALQRLAVPDGAERP